MTDRELARVIAQRARDDDDFAGWLAGVLAQAAGELGSTEALLFSRPGSWEADLVRQLVHGTVGWEDEYLPVRGPEFPGDGRVSD